MKIGNLYNRARLGAGIIVVAFAIIAASPAAAQRFPGSVGIGGQIGSPSGLTVKVYKPESLSYDFLAAWDTRDFFFLNVHAQYERHLDDSQRAHVFFGPGGFVGFEENGSDDDNPVFGISGRLGLNYLFERFEVYAQVTPRLALTPNTDGDFGGGVGFRYYF